MALLSLHNVRVAYHGPLLLDNASLQIERGERVCVVGRNGRGQITLLKLICGAVRPDGGEVALQAGARIALLPQEVPEGTSGTVFEVVANGLEESGEDAQHKVSAVISRLKLDAAADFVTLSGGMKRRVLLAQALVNEPDVLLLDEPTNHLDIDSIAWLEEFLLRSVKTLLFVTHDRAFLRKLATRIVEIDRGQLSSWQCDYDTYVERKAALLEAQAKQWAVTDKLQAARGSVDTARRQGAAEAQSRPRARPDETARQQAGATRKSRGGPLASPGLRAVRPSRGGSERRQLWL